MEEYYEPREDSQLIRKHIRDHAHGAVLDMGCGSGILTVEAAMYADFVVGVDINRKAAKETKRKTKHMEHVTIKHSDMFGKVTGEFDLIVCNPPYLPKDPNEEDNIYSKALAGGKHGYEFVQAFLFEAGTYLKPNGKILLLFSSLTKKNKVDEFVEENCFVSTQIDSLKLPFEELFVYVLEKNPWLKFFESKNVDTIRRLTKGKRGEIYVGLLHGKKIAMKVKRTDSKAMGTIKNEGNFLKELNKHNIGPTMREYGEDYLMYEFVEGELIGDFIKKNEKEKIKDVFYMVFDKMRTLDTLGIQKEEMHHPVKHILVGTEVKLLDFERCRKTEKPSNVTQFIQFVYHVQRDLKKKGISVYDEEEMRELSRLYKDDYSQQKYEEIKKKIFCN